MIMINDKVDGLRKCNEPKSGSHLPLICILQFCGILIQHFTHLKNPNYVGSINFFPISIAAMCNE